MKSAILLAGLLASGETTVVEPLPTRDHTERMLERAGASVTRRPKSVSVHGASRLELDEVEIPGDFSSAAPLLVAAAIVPGSDLTVHGVGLNPRRTGLLDVLERMGARLAIYNRRLVGGEPAGDVEIRASELVGATVSREQIPALVDELPLFALAAAHARGDSVVRGAGELRLKETDRIDGVAEGLRRLGRTCTRDLRRLPDQGRAGADPRRRLRGTRRPPAGDARSRRGHLLDRGRRARRRRRGRDELPGFFQVLEQLSAV